MVSRSVLPQIAEPQPITPVVIKDVDTERRKIKFDAIQPAMREIKAKGFGILAEKPQSGWCVLIVNQCFDFTEVVTWMQQLQTEAAESD